MGGLKLVNETGHDIILYGGTGGIHRPLLTIPSQKKHVLEVNLHETYREYRCRLPTHISKKSEAVVLTSDDIAEYTHLTIRWDQHTDTLSYEMEKQSGSNAVANNPSGVSGQSIYRIFQWLVDKLGGKKELSPNAVAGGGAGGGGEGGGEGGGNGGNDDAIVLDMVVR